MHFTTFALKLLAISAIGVNAQNLRFPPEPIYMQQHHADAQKTKELQQLLGQAINDASSAYSLPSMVTQMAALPVVSLPCMTSLKSLFLNKSNTMVMVQMVDAIGKPAAGIFQGATTWPGNFDQCVVDLGMNHCMMPFNTSFAKGTPLAPLCVAGPTGGPSWGVCLPQQCGEDDALSIANFALQQILPKVAATVPQLAFLENLSMSPGKCRSAESPVPKLDGGMIFFLVIIGIIGLFTVMGTAYDYFIVELELTKKAVSDFDFKTLEKEAGSNQNGMCPANVDSIQVKPKKSKKLTPKELIVQFILCFSMLTNGKKLLSLAPTKDNVGCINGIRFLSLTWVILGHTYAFFISTQSNPAHIITTVMKRVTIQPIINGTFSVDSFFVLSGLLTAYLFFKRSGEKPETNLQKVKTALSMYLHRYLRLTPALGILMGFSTLLPLYMTSGPMSATEESLENACEKYWWYNILYINNFKIEAGACAGHVWYLANDMQFFLLSPIILYAFKFHEIAGYIVSAVFWLTSAGVTIGITSSGNYSLMILDMGNGFADVYIKPWTRIGPYIIGMVAGYFLYKYRRDDSRPCWVTSLIWWVLSAVFALSVVYGLSDYYKNGTTPSKAVDVLYLSFSRSAWGLAVSWLVVACATGRAGPINTLLSWTAFGPVSRMNYSAYLYHILLMTIVMQNMKSFFAYSDYFMATIYCGLLVMSYGVAFLTAIWFESPFIGLEKLIF